MNYDMINSPDASLNHYYTTSINLRKRPAEEQCGGENKRQRYDLQHSAYSNTVRSSIYNTLPNVLQVTPGSSDLGGRLPIPNYPEPHAYTPNTQQDDCIPFNNQYGSTIEARETINNTNQVADGLVAIRVATPKRIAGNPKHSREERMLAISKPYDSTVTHSARDKIWFIINVTEAVLKIYKAVAGRETILEFDFSSDVRSTKKQKDGGPFSSHLTPGYTFHKWDFAAGDYILKWFSEGHEMKSINIHVVRVPITKSQDDMNFSSKVAVTPTSIVSAQLSANVEMPPPPVLLHSNRVNLLLIVPGDDAQLCSSTRAALANMELTEHVVCDDQTRLWNDRGVTELSIVVIEYKERKQLRHIEECKHIVDDVLLLIPRKGACASILRLRIMTEEWALHVKHFDDDIAEATYEDLPAKFGLAMQQCLTDGNYAVTVGAAFIESTNISGLCDYLSSWTVRCLPKNQKNVYVCFKVKCKTARAITEVARAALEVIKAHVGHVTDEGSAYGCIAVFISCSSLQRWVIDKKKDQIQVSMAEHGLMLTSIYDMNINDVEQMMKEEKNKPFIGRLFDLTRRMVASHMPLVRPKERVPSVESRDYFNRTCQDKVQTHSGNELLNLANPDDNRGDVAQEQVATHSKQKKLRTTLQRGSHEVASQSKLHDVFMDWEGTQPSTQDASQYESYSPQKPTIASLISLNPSVHPDIPIKKDEITIGRKLDCDVRFEDPRISGNHCRLFRTPTEFGYRYFIEDLSSNGTFVNCRLVGKGQRALLRTGDQISLVSRNSEKREFGCYVFKEIIEKREEALEGIFQHYDFVSELGSGNFSVVKLAMRKDTGEYFAVKVINKRKFWHIPKTREQIVREVEVLKTIKHVNIISYLAIYDTEDTLYIVLELATGGELFDRLVNTGPFKESEAKIVFRQMVEAVAYLHSQDIVHRDLKPENVLFVNKDTKSLQVKIADFGLARFIQEKEFMTTLCGTPQYVAPEIVRYGNKTDNSLGYSKAVDMWSLGVMLYIMLSGCPPFDEENNPSMNLYEQIENACYSFPLESWGDVSTGAINLIKALLQADPQKRLTAVQALRHPWIQQQARPVPAQVKRPTVLGKRVRAEDDDIQEDQVTRMRPCKKLRSDVSVTKLAAMKISDH